MPSPTGPFAVAIVEINLGAAPRVATLWYPGTSTGGVATAPGRLPVILYFPGWGGDRIGNATLAAELASHGFVVAGVDDPMNTGPMDFSSDAARTETLRRIDGKLAAGVAVAGMLLDALGRLDEADPGGRFTGRLNVSHVGIVGYSFGGAIAAEASLTDSRVAAVVNMDGWLFGRAAEDGVRRPYLLLSDDTPAPTAAELASSDPAIRVPAEVDERDLRGQGRNWAAHGGYSVTLRRTNHLTFSDVLLRSPARRLRAIRGADPVAAQRVIGAVCLSFFRHVLLRQGDALPDPRVLPDMRIDVAIPPRGGGWT